MSDKSDSSVKLFSYSDDQPVDGRGLLIPNKKSGFPKNTFTPTSARGNRRQAVTRVALSFLGIFALAILGTTGYGLVAKTNLASAPSVGVVDSETKNISTLGYGPQESLSQNNIFIQTRDEFIDESMTFVEVDLTRDQLRFFQNGVLMQSAEVLAVGADGSWHEVPSGLYKVEKKEEEMFSPINQANLPWLITFQGNYLIHGQPTYPDGEEVADDFAGGGIQIHNESAEELFDYIKIGVPVLVHDDTKSIKDGYVYEQPVSELHAKYYYIGDIENETILSSKGLTEVAPIASLVKLMTAVVASEKVSLDDRVRVTSPTFVTSLIPRLSERNSVSMYSLMQLLLIESSNEAAETIAGEVGREEFIDAMNAKARQLGMMDTQFADPSGLSSDNLSSIKDLHTLTKYIFENKNFIFDITASEALSGVYVGDEFAGLVNFNEIEGIDGFVGGKVGETLAAGQTSISLHEVEFKGEKRTLVVILLNTDERTQDIDTLISQVTNRFDY